VHSIARKKERNAGARVGAGASRRRSGQRAGFVLRAIVLRGVRCTAVCARPSAGQAGVGRAGGSRGGSTRPGPAALDAAQRRPTAAPPRLRAGTRAVSPARGPRAGPGRLAGERAAWSPGLGSSGGHPAADPGATVPLQVSSPRDRGSLRPAGRGRRSGTQARPHPSTSVAPPPLQLPPASRARGASAPAPRDSGRTGRAPGTPTSSSSLARAGGSAGIPRDWQPPHGSARPGAPLGNLGEGW
ncbi:PREDICTED: translation initiation factor IF-2-like, partial [Chinchilla lanigera]|uniref:translation initiation factor IF-2-like n=1 Tax=Chinchilla lanigera TaxID=34839 RepID=UPI000696469F